MAAESAKIVDFHAYREARARASAAAAEPVSSNVTPPLMMWVPVWAYVPVMAGPWLYAR